MNHITNLQTLSIIDNCVIDDEMIKNLNLIKLNSSWNKKIRNINHMTNLQILYIRYNLKITNEEIQKLN